LFFKDKWLPKERVEYQSVAINRHIASLAVPKYYYCPPEELPFKSDNYFPIYTSNGIPLKYPCKSSTTNEIEYEKLKPTSRMPAFIDQPIACLSFTGLLNDELTFFGIDEEEKSEISALKAFHLYVKCASISPSEDKLNGTKLEYIGGLSAVLASRYANGCFFKFVERFAYHLTFKKKPWKLENSQLLAESMNIFQKLTVPFLAPPESVWDEKLKELLTIHCKAKLRADDDKAEILSGGTCQLFGNTEQYDLSILDGAENQVIAMEFKLHVKPLCNSEFKSIFRKLHDHTTASIAFVVAIDFEPALDNKSNWSGLPENFTIYSLAPVGETNVLSFARIFPRNSDNVEGTVSMMQGEDVSTKDVEKSIASSMIITQQDLQTSATDQVYAPQTFLKSAKRPLTIILVSLKFLNLKKTTWEFLTEIDSFPGGI
jgi:hypothetical protein